MSIEAMKWAMEQTIVKSATDRHVLLVIANNAREDGTGAFPSISSTARKTGLSERAVQYSLRRLVECGAIRPGNQTVVAANIKRADQRPNCYDLALERGAFDDIKRGAPRAPGAFDDTNGVHLTTKRGAPHAPEPNIEPNIEIKPTRTRATPQKRSVIAKPDSVTETVWADFTALRKAKHAPLTQTAVDGIEREARKAKVSLQTALETCCVRGWQGFRADWYAPPSKPGGGKYAGAARAIYGPDEGVGSYV